MSKKSEPQTISQKLEAFEQLVGWFDTENFSLEEALGKFKQAEKLATEIETELATIKHSVEVLKTKFDQTNG